MSKRLSIKTSIADAVSYWSGRVDECGLSVDWIRAYSVPFYDTFWGIRGQQEYKFLYGRSFRTDLSTIIRRAELAVNDEEILSLMKEKMTEISKQCSVHFGEPYFNTATMAGMYRMLIKELAAQYHIPLSSLEENTRECKKPWWYIDS